MLVRRPGCRRRLGAWTAFSGGVAGAGLQHGNVSGFRTFSGFFIAAMILLMAVIFIMTVRR